jgi:sugar fermentation stimulation protein A
VTTRGAKHLAELSDMVRDGHRAVMLYLVQRDDCPAFTLARDIDPDYGKAYDRAITAGVEILGYTCQITPVEIVVTRRVDALG